MSDYLTAWAGAGTFVAVGLTMMFRARQPQEDVQPPEKGPQSRKRGQHRARRAFGAVAPQGFRYCAVCGVDTVAVLRADGSHTCAEGHCTRPGGAP